VVRAEVERSRPTASSTPDTAGVAMSHADAVNVNVTSAAEACRVRREIIEKHLKAGRFPNAFFSGETNRGVWMIPLDDLRAAGLRPDPSGSSAVSGSCETSRADSA
jgi:hypothetical protein